jgi:ABC-2 type transport system ATP-binding protein
MAGMLVARGLVRRFGDRLAVDSVDFEVQAGEIFGLLGPNGAGKTTILRMLGGLIPPTDGQVRVAGVPLVSSTAHAARQRIGFLTETPGLWEALTVADNLAIYARLFGVRNPLDEVHRALARFGLLDRRADPASVLSKGMKQKLALARALIHDPPIVLLDEPTANLDPQTARDVRDLLIELRDRGRAVIVSTHNLDEIERVADRIALISTRLIAIGPPDELRRRIFGRRLRIRLATGDAAAFTPVLEREGATAIRRDGDVLTMAMDDPDAGLPGLVRALVEAGAAIREVSEESPPLEEVYMRLVAPSGHPDAAGARDEA